MDDLTLLRSFRAERADEDPRPRAAAWRALEEKFGPTPASALAEVPRSRWRGLLALAGAGAVAATVAAVLLLSSGPSAESAAAEVLHETAAVAGSGEGAPALQARRGQYYFVRTKTRELMGWYPGGYSIPEAPTSRPGGFSALIPTETQTWTSPQGGGRLRETMGTPEFRSNVEESRWEQAGSPLPIGFEPRYDKKFEEMEVDHQVLEASRGVLDFETVQPNSGAEIYPDLSSVPTDPKGLRQAIEAREVPGVVDEQDKPVEIEGLIGALGTILSRPNASPELREAAFNVLAETPGVGLNREATDLLGRSGYAVSYTRPTRARVRLRTEFIFDPQTSDSLGERIVLADSAGEPQWKGYEAGLAIRDVAFLQSGVVDSTHETPEEQAGGRVTATAPVYRR
jgi:hypothetical protein